MFEVLDQILGILMKSLLSLDASVMLLSALTAFSWGESFYNLDGDVQDSDWFKQLSTFWKFAVRKFMDVNHHWQYGFLLNIIGLVWYDGLLRMAFQSAAIGFIASDLKDFDNVLKRFGLSLKEATTNPPSTTTPSPPPPVSASTTPS